MYKGCDYQISRIYELVGNKENPVEYSIITGGGSQINLPDPKSLFSEMDSRIIDGVLNARDETFRKSMKYMLNGERALFLGFPPEKVALDLMKSMEVIVKSFQRGRKKQSFGKMLKMCAKEIGLTEDERLKIKDAWKARGNGDVAHATRTSQSEFFPPQYPVPSDVSMNITFGADLSVAVLLKYFRYKEGEVRVVIDTKSHWDIGEFIDVNFGSHYSYNPKPNEKKGLTNVLRRHISERLGVQYRDVSKRHTQGQELIFKVRQR